MKAVKMFVIGVVAVLAAGDVLAQDTPPSLRDLVGIEKGSGGYEMQQRGYKYIRTDTAGREAWDYWQQTENGACVVVHVSDNRFASISNATYDSCKGDSGNHGSYRGESHGGDSYDREDKFDSVCGVIVDGQNYRYKCRVVNFYEGSNVAKTALHYPDINIRLVWKSGNQAVVHMEGTKPYDVRYSRSEGETNFQMDGKTYFYISDKRMAEMEARDFRN